VLACRGARQVGGTSASLLVGRWVSREAARAASNPSQAAAPKWQKVCHELD